MSLEKGSPFGDVHFYPSQSSTKGCLFIYEVNLPPLSLMQAHTFTCNLTVDDFNPNVDKTHKSEGSHKLSMYPTIFFNNMTISINIPPLSLMQAHCSTPENQKILAYMPTKISCDVFHQLYILGLYGYPLCMDCS